MLEKLREKLKTNYIVSVDVVIDNKLVGTLEVEMRHFSKFGAVKATKDWAHKNLRIKISKTHKKKNK